MRRRGDAIEHWHTDVHENGIGPVLGRPRDGVRAVGCCMDVEPGSLQEEAHDFQEVGMIIDHEHARRGSCDRVRRPPSTHIHRRYCTQLDALFIWAVSLNVQKRFG